MDHETIVIDYIVHAGDFRSVSANFWNATAKETAWIIVLDNAFDSAQKFFHDNPGAKRIVWNWLNPRVRRDEFGNLITPVRYSSVATATLTRAKSQKLNWNFIRSQACKGYPIEFRKYLSASRGVVPKTLPSFYFVLRDKHTRIRREYRFTAGRVIVRGKLTSRGERTRADYLLFYSSEPAPRGGRGRV